MTFEPRSIANRGNGFELNMNLNNDLNILEADFIYLNSDKEFDKRYPGSPSVGDMRWGYRIQSASNLKFGILKLIGLTYQTFIFLGMFLGNQLV